LRWRGSMKKRTMAARDELSLRRVVVALDASSAFAPTIEMAASVAAAWGAALHVLFVEDEGLHRVAGMPFTQQVDALTAARLPLDAIALDAQSSALARRVRRELARIAGAYALSWSFDATRARIDSNTISLADGELLTVALAARRIGQVLRLPSLWHDALAHVRHPLLLIPERPDAEGPIAVLYDAVADGRRALEASIRIARKTRRPLIVVVKTELTQAHRAEMGQLMRSNAIEPRVLQLAGAPRTALHSVVASEHVTLCIVDRAGTEWPETQTTIALTPSSALLLI